jgi:restriction system protein
LQVLDSEGPLPAREAYPHLAAKLGLTDADLALLLPSGGQSLFENRAGWAKTYLKKAGLIDSPKRGVWRLTDRGRKVLATRPRSISKADLLQFREFVEFTSGAGTPSAAEDSAAVEGGDGAVTPTEAMEEAFQQLREELVVELLERVKADTPAFFERLVVDLMLAMGYGGSRKEAGEATQMTADGGIDGLIREDKLGLDTIYLQAKKWDGTVGRPEVQKFAGALQGERARKGVMITTSTFSAGARQYVERLDSKIVLIDGPRLATLMIDHNVGVATKQRYEVKDVDGDYFE